MFTDPNGPIESFSWGCFQIDGAFHSADGKGVGKDIFILDGVVHPWHERKGHTLKPAMVTRALKADVPVLIIGNGVNGALNVPKKTRKLIMQSGVTELIIEKTPKACATYNRLVREGKRVTLLAHGTC
jgi:hypothetical protein